MKVEQKKKKKKKREVGKSSKKAVKKAVKKKVVKKRTIKKIKVEEPLKTEVKEPLKTEVKEPLRREVEEPLKVKNFVDLEGKFLHIKVGDKERPASEDDIKGIQKNIQDIFDQNDVNCIAFVTHHAVEVKIIEKSGL